ncbi:MAG: hypothetical protein IKY83_14405 [Proteobacteria bacterium]|nr:hypothetical protein [Pseudomonadota bacterium]
MVAASKRFVVCYSLGCGAGLSLQLSSLGRQICEDLAEILALNEGFVTVPQMLVVREQPEIDYSVTRNACVFAVFYSLPETRWILDATRSIGGDIALTGRIMDDESGLILSVNMLDVRNGVLLFCGYETCEHQEIQLAVARLGAKILSHFTERSAASWQPDVQEMLGTVDYHAYANWMNMRELERRAQREGAPVPQGRVVEHLTHALQADPHYIRAGLKLCEMMSGQLERASYEFILRYLTAHANETEALSLIVVQCLARLGRRAEAESQLDRIIERHPGNGLFWLMRGCLRTDERLSSRDLDEARHLLGNDFNGCRSAVDNALLNVTGV